MDDFGVGGVGTGGSTPFVHSGEDSNDLSRRETSVSIDELAATEERLNRQGRAALGIGVTTSDDRSSLLSSLRASGVGAYPLVALCALGLPLLFQTLIFNLYTPEIAHSLGLGVSEISTLSSVRWGGAAIAAIVVVALVQHRPRRAVVAVTAAIVWALSTVLIAFTTNLWFGIGILAVNGIATGAILTVQAPLVTDLYPPGVRVRSFALLQSSVVLGWIVAAGLAVICSGPLGLSWRGIFLVLGFINLVAALAAVRLRDPGIGKWDMDRVREVVRGGSQQADSAEEIDGDGKTTLGFFETFRVVLFRSPAALVVLGLAAPLGSFLIPFGTYTQFYLQQRWDLGPGTRAGITCALPILAIPLVLWFGRFGEGTLRNDPMRLLGTGARIVGISGLLLLVAVLVPVFGVMVALLVLSFAGFFVAGPMVFSIGLSLVPPARRLHLAALMAVAFSTAGIGGVYQFSIIDGRFGVSGAVFSFGLQPLGLLLLPVAGRRFLSPLLKGGMDQVVHDLVEAEELEIVRRSGQRLPLLSCRHVDFSYGSVQVLFDVSFTVEDGEMVALLGTNGSGKSTLLRVVSGLGLPTRGTVHLSGAEITHLDAERRVGLGIAQVPGGRSVFRSMSVIENLRVFGQTRRRDRAHMEQAIDAIFDAFPVLAARRNAKAATLSGGEQQMLALGRTFILQPRILLIDELSLGLAPLVVGQLLAMVKHINELGTAVVLVEQSVNIALTTVQHAYYMERGAVQFDGDASALLQREDLLRSVFLEGAVRGLSKGNGSGDALVTSEQLGSGEV